MQLAIKIFMCIVAVGVGTVIASIISAYVVVGTMILIAKINKFIEK